MASIADLRMRPDMEHSYLLLIEGVPFAFTDEPAIAEGATIVRVGTAIFGERVKPASTPAAAGSA